MRLLVASAVIFRCDTIILIGPLALQVLFTLIHRGTSFFGAFPELAKCGLTTGACCLATTVIVDSFFWQRWLWPEGEVLFL